MSGLPELIGNSPAILAVRDEVCRLLRRQVGGRPLPPILIQGETGTGKGLLAGAIHRAGPRQGGPFVAVNCAAIPDTLLEAELFGFERGAFTDARQAKAGLVQTAHRGTLFLDEIGLLPAPLQGKLLTVIEERMVRRLGRTRSEAVDIAVLSATSDDLERAVRERRFMEALYHRLSVVTLRLPPLRERVADIFLLAEHFLGSAGAGYGVPPRKLTPEARAALLAYSWPGNVRELNNRMERVTLLAESGLVTREMLGLPETSPPELREGPSPPDARQLRERIGDVERESLIEALAATDGNLTRAAERLGVARTTLRYRLRRYGLVVGPPLRESLPDLRERAPGQATQPVDDAGPTTVPPPETIHVRPGEGRLPVAQASVGKRELVTFPSATPVTNRCPNCGVGNPPAAEFCMECTAALTTPPIAPSLVVQADHASPHQHEQRIDGGPVSRGRFAAEAERRQLTVMSCGLGVSTALAEQLDPEDWREAVQAFQGACTEVIRRFEGYVAQYLGDGLVLYFGYPLAHEDDARRAVRAGLETVGEMGRLNSRLEREWGVRLIVRLAIHTGVVVVGKMGVGDKREPLALGEAPQIAAQLLDLAEADTVVISSATYRLTQGYFDCRELGAHTLGGLSQPLAVYRVLQEGAAQSRFDVAVSTGLTPLVGREQEVALLCERWEHTKEGLGQVVLLSGEPGIGKSRLVQVLKERIAGEPHARLECRCSPYYQSSAFYPMIDSIQQALKFGREDSPQEKLRKLEGALELYGLSLEEVMPLFAPLLSLPLSERYAPLPLTPQRQKQKTVEALLAWLLREAEKQVVLSVWEDLQWMDPSTLEFLSLLIDQSPTSRMLILLTSRPDFTPPWATRSYLTQIALGRLSRRQVEAMVKGVAGVTGGKVLPPGMLQQVAAKTDGIPLFVEELTKMVLESELFEDGTKDHTTAEPLPPVTIPSTLHDSLMARLDRLGAGKQVAQLGATLGREFTYDLIRVVSSVDEVTLQRELTRLTDAELLYQRGLPPHARYAFKHALIQDAAYQSLLKSQRQQYHRQIALVLEERFAEIRESQPELLAHHYTEAGLMKDAIVYWQRAGQRAIEHSANVEAIGHLTKGLAVLRFLPNTPERTGHELTLQLTLGAPLMMIRGQTAPEVERTYIRAHELCQHGGDNRQKFAALAGLCGLYLNRAQLRKAHELGEECLALAEGQQDPVLLQEAHRILGSASFFLGHFTAARRHLEHGVAAYDPHQPPSRAFSSGADPRIVCLSRMAWALWMLGYPDQALKRAQEALVRAEESSHAYSLVFATYYGAVLRQSRREAKLAQEGAERATALARDHGFIHWVAAGTCMRGWALAEQGIIEEGLVQLWQGLTSWLEMGIEQAHTHLLSRMAEAYRRGGRAQEGLRVLSEAFMLAQTHKNEERYHEAELYRLKGHLLLLEDTANEQHAEKCFRHAVDVARQQQAKSLELRAAMSLSCLWQARGRTAEARGLLTEISGWFTEGFATADLQEARSLLEAWV